VKPPTPNLYRDIAYYAKLAGSEPMPWESKRARDLVSTLASRARRQRLEV
jgi:glyceraldehyde-3-phosphate dehydrogenase (ferredoxin)